jgi:hypothetical protein
VDGVGRRRNASVFARDRNDTDGSNGLPSITSPLTIVGTGIGNTIIEREAIGAIEGVRP